MRRFVVLVIDGLGVGQMDDVPKTRPQDNGANTLKNIILQKKIKLPYLKEMGVLDYFLSNTFIKNSYADFSISLGKCNLAHFGADSYMGHQEIAGSKPKKPMRQFVREEKEKITEKLNSLKIKTQWVKKMIIVDKHIAIADNIETDYGLNINVVGSLDHYPYPFIEKVGRLVRETVKVGRVITMGGVDVSCEDFFRCLEIKTKDGYTAWGINIPKLKIYNDRYRVIHMGHGVNPERQTPQILTKNGVVVVLIGKTADVIKAEEAFYHPQVSTKKVLNEMIQQLDYIDHGFIFANIQETDLAGHEQDVVKYSRFLELIDAYLPKILGKLDENDVFLITGDHGNDPTIGHTNHTREKTPLILFSKQFLSQDLGTRQTLADIGASVASFFHVPSPEFGRSFI